MDDIYNRYQNSIIVIGNMAFSLLILIGWCVCILTCYYLIRPIPTKLVRFVLTCCPCVLLTYITCDNLTKYNTISILTISVCWFIGLHLIALTVFPIQPSVTFRAFLSQIFWVCFPILTKKTAKNQWPLISIIILLVTKLFINHWIYRWSIKCETEVSYQRILIFYVSLATISYLQDTLAVFIRILTRDKYTIETFTDFPIVSCSLREFWGRRYNRIVQTVLKESIFKPMRLELSSSIIAALLTFFISGLLHAHICFVVFDSQSSIFPTFIFFVMHGIACAIERKMNIKIPGYIGWITTQMFLLITVPFVLGPFVEKGSPFLLLNAPLFIDIEWIPRLPTPNFCPY